MTKLDKKVISTNETNPTQQEQIKQKIHSAVDKELPEVIVITEKILYSPTTAQKKKLSEATSERARALLAISMAAKILMNRIDK